MQYFYIEENVILKRQKGDVNVDVSTHSMITLLCLNDVSFYSKAIELYPTHSSIIMKFAGFQRHAKKNLTEAEKYYRQACNVNPTNSDAIGNLG